MASVSCGVRRLDFPGWLFATKPFRLWKWTKKKKKVFKNCVKLGVVLNACNPSSQEGKTDGSGVQDHQPQLP